MKNKTEKPSKSVMWNAKEKTTKTIDSCTTIWQVEGVMNMVDSYYTAYDDITGFEQLLELATTKKKEIQDKEQSHPDYALSLLDHYMIKLSYLKVAEYYKKRTSTTKQKIRGFIKYLFLLGGCQF